MKLLLCHVAFFHIALGKFSLTPVRYGKTRVELACQELLRERTKLFHKRNKNYAWLASLQNDII